MSFYSRKKSSEDKDPNNLIYLSAEIYYSANNVIIDVWFFKAIFKFCTTKKSFKYQQSFSLRFNYVVSNALKSVWGLD